LWKDNRDRDYGDWLNADTWEIEGMPKEGGEVPKDILATAFWANSTRLVAEMAKILGYKDVVDKYSRLFRNIKLAFQKAYVKDDGRIVGDTQAGYTLALWFGLLPEEFQKKAAKYLVEGMDRYKGHLSTGIQTTHRAMLLLSMYGYSDEAYRLISTTEVPSWGGMLENGATTVWERWDGYIKGRGLHTSNMNSMNHWALGSVGEWIWRTIVGINPGESNPGYKQFMIRPYPDGDLSWVRGEYDSIRGQIVSDWRIEKGKFIIEVKIPVNSSAIIYLPSISKEDIQESGHPINEAKGVIFIKTQDETSLFRVESGFYEFLCPYTKNMN
jgi:alpha-L-rhamnosidase